MINRDEIDPQGAIIRQTAEAAVAISEELESLNPNIEIDAKEFGEHVRNGGWRLGLLVARSVEKGAGEGGDPSTRSHRSILSGGKISSKAFARQARSISPNTVTKYLNAWNMAATDGLVPNSSDIVPGQEIDFTLTDDNDKLILSPQKWDEYFKTKGEENSQTVYDFFKGLAKYDDEAIRNWIQVENFHGQTDFRPKDVFDFLSNINRVSALGIEIYLSIEDSLGMVEEE